MSVCSGVSLGKHALGIFCVLLVVFLWVSSSELTQSIFRNNNYFHPFFLTYFNTSLFMVYGPFFIRLCVYSFKGRRHGSNNPSPYSVLSTEESPSHMSQSHDSEHNPNYQASINATSPHGADRLTRPIADLPQSEKIEIINNDHSTSNTNQNNNNINNNSNNNNKVMTVDDIELEHDDEESSFKICSLNWFCIPYLSQNQLSLFETFKISCVFCPVWFLMNYAFNASLDKTSVASNTILSTMSGPFSLILSFLFLKTRFSIWNVAGVAIVVAGAVLIGYLDDTSSDGNGTLFGDALALTSALIYGSYVTLLKHRLGDESRANMFLFFTLIGLINVLTLWPFLFLLNWLEVETFKWPSNDVLLLLTVNGLISVLSDYFWAQSVLLTSPVVATVGLSLMMPLAMVADEIFRDQKHSLYYWLGSLCVTLGFILVNLDFKNEEERKLTELQDHMRDVKDVIANFHAPEERRRVERQQKEHDIAHYESATPSMGGSDTSDKDEDEYTTDAGL